MRFCLHSSAAVSYWMPEAATLTRAPSVVSTAGSEVDFNGPTQMKASLRIRFYSWGGGGVISPE